MDISLLELSIYIPLIAAFVLIAGGLSESISKQVAFIGFGLPFAIALYLAYQFCLLNPEGADYLFRSDRDTGLSFIGISLKLGLNAISLPMYLLAAIVGFAAGIYAMFSGASRLKLYLGLLLLMQTGLLGAFASIDIFFFYLFHEFALIPTFIMIGIWGGQGRRSAAIEMTVYLTVGAMISLAGLIALYCMSPAYDFDMISLRSYMSEVGIVNFMQENIFGLLLLGFGILVSLWPFHSWAPRGYAAAPSSTAMLHAGVLKKFGLYGLIQIALPILPMGALEWSDLIVWLALGNVLIIGLVTISQTDLKLMLGYSSVMHMGYAFLGIASFNVIGIGGAIMLMFAHGLSTALLFMLSTSIYRRVRTYDMQEMGGLGAKTPILAGFFIAATMAGIGLPGFANFWGELSIFIGLWESYSWAVAPAVVGIVISAIYGLRAVANIFFGTPSNALKEKFELNEPQDIRLSERIPATILLAALLIVGLWPQSISEKLNEALEAEYPWTLQLNQMTTTPMTDTHDEGLVHRLK